MTAKDAAHAANTGASGVQEFLAYASAHDIEEFCHGLVDGHHKWFPLARIALDIKLSEDAERTAQKLVTGTDTLITGTKTLVGLTRSLKTLTIVLVALGLFDVIKFLLDLVCHH